MSPVLEAAPETVARIIIGAEAIAVMLLLIPLTRWYGLILAALLMSLFTAYIAYMLITASALPCSCGGIISKLGWKEHLWLNIILFIIACLAVKAGAPPAIKETAYKKIL